MLSLNLPNNFTIFVVIGPIPEIFNNKLMVFAAVFGITLQVLVTEISFLNDFFKTSQLGLLEWCYILGLSFMTLIAHEILVLCMKLRQKRKK